MDDDTSRPIATTDDNFTLTIAEVAKRYEHAGHPRTIRALQRYCKLGHLDARKIQTKLSDMYLVAPHPEQRSRSRTKSLEALRPQRIAKGASGVAW